MKHALILVVPFILALALSSARADDVAANEWTGTVGCQSCDFGNATGAKSCGAAIQVGDKVFTLKGSAIAKDYKKGGEYTVKGKISDDGKSIDVTEMKKKA